MRILSIKNLHVSLDDKRILQGIDLRIKPGEIHALMGPNGSGKSTLAQVIMGYPDFSITKGSIRLGKQNISKLSPDQRARLGLYLAFQYPVEVPGVSLVNFLRQAYNIRKSKEAQLGVRKFRSLMLEKLKELDFEKNFLSRNLNEGFSGGEKKKMEIIQLAILEPKIAILDETDSGLDIDSLKTVAKGIKKIRKVQRKGKNPLGILLITHYQRILRYIQPDFVHVMVKGRIVRSGRSELIDELEKDGYRKYSVGR